MSSPQIIGITGGIGTGKTFVCKIIANYGFSVLNSDKIAHQVLNKNKQVIDIVKKNFGTQVIAADGSIDRKKLGQIVFKDFSKLKILNHILDSYLKEAIFKEVQKAPKPVFIEIPLLYEQNYQSRLDQVIVVYADDLTAIKRIQKRDHIDKQFAIKKVKSQMSIRKKMKMTKYLINTADPQVQKQVHLILQELKLI